jgi:DNA-binding NtrC family response regulator
MTASARILIVDDDPQLRTFLSLTFAEAGYTVRTASSGEDAIEQCAAEQFDLILSDVVMPKLDGHQLAQWIATQCPDTQTVLMSGWDPGCHQGPHSLRCRLIAKPFDAHQILLFVAEILAESARSPSAPENERS